MFSSKIRASSRSLAGISNNWKTKKLPLCNHKSFSSSSSGPNWRNNGTPEIVIGTTILSLLLVDQILQMYNKNENSVSKKAVIYELERAIEKDQLALKRSTNNANISVASHPLVGLDGKELASLYKCQIMKIPKYFDGTRSLQNVEVDDVVQVLKEFVGPDSNYHLCRIEKKKLKDKAQTEANNGNNEDQQNSLIQKLDATYHYGWFPVTCLKKM